MNIRKSSWNLQKWNRLYGLVACYHMLRHGMTQAYEDLGYWGVNVERFDQLEQKILQDRTRLNIEEIQKKSITQEKIKDFEEFLVIVENSLGRNLDADNISVKKWIFILKSIDDKARAIENVRKNNVTGHPRS